MDTSAETWLPSCSSARARCIYNNVTGRQRSQGAFLSPISFVRVNFHGMCEKHAHALGGEQGRDIWGGSTCTAGSTCYRKELCSCDSRCFAVLQRACLPMLYLNVSSHSHFPLVMTNLECNLLMFELNGVQLDSACCIYVHRVSIAIVR